MANRVSIPVRRIGNIPSGKRTVSFAKAVMVCCFLGWTASLSYSREYRGVHKGGMAYGHPVSVRFYHRNDIGDNP